ncbi:MAG: STAS/SEC14 domain-containing protein [Blastocatellia bacterium]
MANGTEAILIDAGLAAAYNSAPKTKQKKALSALRRALQEPVSSGIPRLSKKETSLFLRINRGLPQEKQQRYDELRQKREDETLTQAEHAELLQFVEEIETIWADRLQAILALAKLRRISPRELMKQLEIEPRSYSD